MSPAGWVFLVVSVGFVWGLAIWCYVKILGEDPPEN